jgi:hypothetical protein
MITQQENFIHILHQLNIIKKSIQPVCNIGFMIEDDYTQIITPNFCISPESGIDLRKLYLGWGELK